MQKTDAIRHKRNREQQRKCWQLLRTIIHGQKTSGDISYVLIPVPPNPDTPNINPTPRRIQTKPQMDKVLLDRNINHFSQSYGTPFTISPLLEVFGTDGCTEAALSIFDGQIPAVVPHYSKLILQEMRRARDTIKIQLTYNNMIKGLSKWRKQTTTSPSNKHLGLYKSLINATKYNIIKTILELEYITFNH
jgi:hypothetical protein